MTFFGSKGRWKALICPVNGGILKLFLPENPSLYWLLDMGPVKYKKKIWPQ